MSGPISGAPTLIPSRSSTTVTSSDHRTARRAIRADSCLAHRRRLPTGPVRPGAGDADGERGPLQSRRRASASGTTASSKDGRARGPIARRTTAALGPGHPVGGGMTKVVQGPVGTECRSGAAEHGSCSVVIEWPERATPCPPQRIITPGRYLLIDLRLVEPEPHEGIGGSRELLKGAGPLANHRDQLLTRIDVATARPEQFGGHGPPSTPIGRRAPGPGANRVRRTPD